MRFSIAAAVAFAALSSVVRGLAAPGPQATGRPPVSGSANPITSPLGDVALQPGKPYTIKWYVSSKARRLPCLGLCETSEARRSAARRSAIRLLASHRPAASYRG